MVLWWNFMYLFICFFYLLNVGTCFLPWRKFVSVHHERCALLENQSSFQHSLIPGKITNAGPSQDERSFEPWLHGFYKLALLSAFPARLDYEFKAQELQRLPLLWGNVLLVQVCRGYGCTLKLHRTSPYSSWKSDMPLYNKFSVCFSQIFLFFLQCIKFFFPQNQFCISSVLLRYEASHISCACLIFIGPKVTQPHLRARFDSQYGGPLGSASPAHAPRWCVLYAVPAD